MTLQDTNIRKIFHALNSKPIIYSIHNEKIKYMILIFLSLEWNGEGIGNELGTLKLLSPILYTKHYYLHKMLTT